MKCLQLSRNLRMIHAHTPRDRDSAGRVGSVVSTDDRHAVAKATIELEREPWRFIAGCRQTQISRRVPAKTDNRQVSGRGMDARMRRVCIQRRKAARLHTLKDGAFLRGHALDIAEPFEVFFADA